MVYYRLSLPFYLFFMTQYHLYITFIYSIVYIYIYIFIFIVSKLSQTLAVLGDLPNALELAETALQNGMAHFERNGSDERIISDELSRLHLDVADLAAEMALFDKASYHVNIVDSIYRGYQIEIPGKIVSRMRSVISKVA